jgi:transposase
MEKVLRYCIGIDVDKKEFKVCFRSLNNAGNHKTIASRTFSNSPKGFGSFDSWITKNRKDPDAWLVLTMEATGVYHENLAWYFFTKRFNINIVLPLKANRYLQSLGLRSKNDKIDAQGLATMGLQQELELWSPGSIELLKLRSLTRQHEAFQKAKTTFSNQLEAITHAAVSDPLVHKSLKSMLKNLDSEIEKLEAKICKVVEEDSFLAAKWNLMESIKGLGILTFAIIAAETAGFALFNNAKQLTCYAGYDVVENQSGGRAGKTKISKKGNAHLRRAMFMPAFNVVRYEQGSFTDVYQRVFERTKIKMKGFVAVQRKLLSLIFALWKSDQPYNPDHQFGHSREEETIVALSVSVPQGTEEKFNQKKTTKKESPLKNCSPAKGKATLDGPTSDVSTVSPLSVNVKILEKSYA